MKKVLENHVGKNTIPVLVKYNWFLTPTPTPSKKLVKSKADVPVERENMRT